MTTLTKIIVTTLLSLLLFSCNFDINLGGVVGNGNVINESRTINGSFNAIKASEGLNVYLTQSDNESVTVEADENLQDLIITEVVDNVLKIHTKQNIGRATSKKIMVNFKNLSNITSTSGSQVHSTHRLTSNNLELESNSGSNMTLAVSTSSLKCNTSSGSNMTLQLNTKLIECHASSGSNIELMGEAVKLIAQSSSGSNIIAGDLISESSQANASSGSNITVNTSKQLIAKANSGGGIYYYGNPEKVEKNDSASGSVKKK